jgi:hypothetical protein
MKLNEELTPKVKLGIFSGDCLIGICGEDTDLVDYKNETLKIGDIVIVKYNEYNIGTHSDYMSVIVNDKYQSYSDGTIKKTGKNGAFVMGIARVTADELAKENKNGELMDGWYIQKIKDNKECIDKEKWSDYGFNYKEIDVNIIKDNQ